MTARRMATMVVVGVLALSVVTAAQSRGKTKALGKVVDEGGQPLGDVIVAAVLEGMDKPFQQACIELAEANRLTAFTPPDAIVQPWGIQLAEFFSRADTAMYLAKEGGRNQVVVEEPVTRGDSMLPEASVLEEAIGRIADFLATRR